MLESYHIFFLHLFVGFEQDDASTHSRSQTRAS